jgi:regulator of protease activity HflC (stomatin/prohibitin superfamily)
VWLLIAAELAVGEVFTLAFLLGLVAVAALAAGVVAALGAGGFVQLLVFIAVSIASVALLRPVAKAHLRTPATLRTGTAALVGAKAIVRWGIRVNRVELKAIDPPGTIQEAMEKQMRAERDKRAAILTAEGVKQSQILTAEGEKQSAILRAEGRREAQMLEAEGQAKAIETVFGAIHAGNADPKLLAYQYLQVLPQIAQGDSNKVWIIPSEFARALGQVGTMLERGEDARPSSDPSPDRS